MSRLADLRHLEEVAILLSGGLFRPQIAFLQGNRQDAGGQCDVRISELQAT